MENEIERLPILRIARGDISSTQDAVAREITLTVVLNNRDKANLLCSPSKLEYLAVGFLCSQGILKSKDQVRKIEFDQKEGVIYIETVGATGSFSSAEKGLPPHVPGPITANHLRISPRQISSLMKNFMSRSSTFKATGGVHSVALCKGDDILIFSEDIGRHNAIDKVLGERLLKNIPLEECSIATTSRISSGILLKIARQNIPVIISKSAPTDLGVRLADAAGITLIGFARGERMNVYSHSWRVITGREI